MRTLTAIEHYAGAKTAAIARQIYVDARVAEMLSTPEGIAKVLSFASSDLSHKVGDAVSLTIRERVGGLASLIDVLHEAAEVIALEEFSRPPKSYS